MEGFSLREFHRMDREFFRRLVRELGQEPGPMRWVMALWLWLESAGHHEFTRRVAAMPGSVVLRFVDEALACLARLPRRRAGAGEAAARRLDALAADPALQLLPCTNALLVEPIEGIAYFDAHRDEIMEGVSSVYRNVCRVVFTDDDTNANEAAAFAAAFLPRCIRDELDLDGPMLLQQPTQMYGHFSPPTPAPAPPPPMLNPMASPWFPAPSHHQNQQHQIQNYSPLPEDYRSLFITFSRGYPIRQEDIIHFFNSLFGPCVESVLVEKAAAGQLPVYGRVVLRCPSMIPVVLDGQQTAKFMINGRHLWARIYVPSSK
uniref:RRM domain-containing protein n=1 Tax=Leersia perrieri TaxID=77586 RepID=A0A0D9XMG3_9ORYZ